MKCFHVNCIAGASVKGLTGKEQSGCNFIVKYKSNWQRNSNIQTKDKNKNKKGAIHSVLITLMSKSKTRFRKGSVERKNTKFRYQTSHFKFNVHVSVHR